MANNTYYSFYIFISMKIYDITNTMFFYIDIVDVVTTRSRPKQDLRNNNRISKFIFEILDHMYVYLFEIYNFFI